MTRHARLTFATLVAASCVAFPTTEILADPLPPDASYRPLPTVPLDVARRNDEAAKPAVLRRQQNLLNQRYDLANRPIEGLRMSGGRKAIQAGVRVKLPNSTTWESLAQMTPEQIRERDLLPAGFRPLPHVKQTAGGQVFPQQHIDEIGRAEARNLKRFDVDFDLPDHFTPEFPAPIFLTTRPDLGDISGGKLLTIRNYYAMTVGILLDTLIIRPVLTPAVLVLLGRWARWPSKPVTAAEPAPAEPPASVELVND